MENIRNKVDSLENKINFSLDRGINEIFIKYNKKRKFIQYNFKDRFSDEFEMNLRKILLEVERDYENINAEIAFSVSYKNNKAECKNVMINLGENVDYEDEKIITMDEGNYLTMYFDDTYRDSGKYYKKIVDYINKNKIKTVGDFTEIYIMTRVGSDGKEKSLGQIEIKISQVL